MADTADNAGMLTFVVTSYVAQTPAGNITQGARQVSVLLLTVSTAEVQHAFRANIHKPPSIFLMLGCRLDRIELDRRASGGTDLA